MKESLLGLDRHEGDYLTMGFKFFGRTIPFILQTMVEKHVIFQTALIYRKVFKWCQTVISV